MTSPNINASRDALVEDLQRELGPAGANFPYNRIRAGDWKVVVYELAELLSTKPHRGIVENRRAECGRGFVRLAEHARDCPSEEGLLLPLLQGFNAHGTRCLSVLHLTRALETLAAGKRLMNQHEVDELICVTAHSAIDPQHLQSITERGYAPSLGIEHWLTQKYQDSKAYLLVIRRMQPRWHAMRLQSEMSALTTAKVSASEVHVRPSL